MVVTKTGRYKWITILGVVLLGVGFLMLTMLHYGSDPLSLSLSMVVVGIGLGMANSQYTLIVQNNVRRAGLGVATVLIRAVSLRSARLSPPWARVTPSAVRQSPHCHDADAHDRRPRCGCLT